MNLVTIDTAPGNMSMYIAPNNTSYLEVGKNASTVLIGNTKTNSTFNGNVNSQGIMTAISFSSTSDLRMKNILRQITAEEGEQFINNNNPVLFKWKNGLNDSNELNLNSGYIAQELITSGFPHLVSEINNPDLKEPDGPDGKQYILNYDGIIPYHGVAIKHLLQENNELKNEMRQLKQELRDLKSIMNDKINE